MNLFKGLMFLHGHFTRLEDLAETVVQPSEQGEEAGFGAALGNRAASRRWFARNPGAGPRKAVAAAVSVLPAKCG